MTCPQCNADLPDSTPFCPHCGSPLRQAAFSYLPANTPAWPTTVPPLPSYKTGIADSSPHQDGEIATVKPASRPRRSARGILVLVAILVLTPLLGVGATLGILWANGQFTANATQASVHQPPQQVAGTNNTPTATPGQLPTPTSFQTTRSTAVGFSLKYPADWTADAPQKSSDSTVIVFHPLQKNGIFFSIERFSNSTSAKISSTSVVNQSNLTIFANDQTLHNFQPLVPASPRRAVGGLQWDEVDASFANGNGLVIHISSIAVAHNKIYYDIFFSAPTAVYDEAMQKYFQPMFDSFKFQP